MVNTFYMIYQIYILHQSITISIIHQQQIPCIPGYRKFTRLYKDCSQTTSRICQLNVDAKNDIITLENVQRQAIKLAPGLQDLNYPDRLKTFNISPLLYIYICLRGDMFKMVSGTYDEQVMPAIVTAEEGFYQTRSHSYKLPINHNETQLRQHYFSERITCSWNSCLIKQWSLVVYNLLIGDQINTGEVRI